MIRQSGTQFLYSVFSLTIIAHRWTLQKLLIRLFIYNFFNVIKCNFPKAFPNLQLPNGIFPSGNFPMDFSHAATSQLCNVPSGKLPSLLAATLAPPHCSLRDKTEPLVNVCNFFQLKMNLIIKHIVFVLSFYLFDKRTNI